MRRDPPKILRCAVYTRVSTEHGLEQEFNSLDNQREAAEAYIKSQAHEGWQCLSTRYDDGGFSGGSMERPALQDLLLAIQARRIDVVVVYKAGSRTRGTSMTGSIRLSSTRPLGTVFRPGLPRTCRVIAEPGLPPNISSSAASATIAVTP